MAVLTANDASIAEAARHMAADGLVGLPTETVYGLACDATSDKAVASVYEVKGRPSINPLIIHVDSPAMAESVARFDRRARYLVQRNWPGPLTVVLPVDRGGGVSRLALAGLDTIALRMPDHDVALSVIRRLGRPVAAPSANPSGAISPSRAEHVARAFGSRLQIILDGGECAIGLESTILDLTRDPPAVLRPGAIGRDKIVAAIGAVVAADDADPTAAPGRVGRHYAPRLPIRLDDRDPRTGEALLAFGPAPPRGFAIIANLSERGDLTEAAANLFAHLHTLDQPPNTAIAVMPIPDRGLGIAINDRLRRAAGKAG
jgi:L-threonylcarbamoyladenylate synthase